MFFRRDQNKEYVFLEQTKIKSMFSRRDQNKEYVFRNDQNKELIYSVGQNKFKSMFF